MHNSVGIFLLTDVALCPDVRRPSDYAEGVL